MKYLRITAICLCLGVLLAMAAESVGIGVKPFKHREKWVEGIPKDWGRLVNAGSFSDGTSVMFFEATNGVVRRVSVKFFGTDDARYLPYVMTIARP